MFWMLSVSLDICSCLTDLVRKFYDVSCEVILTAVIKPGSLH